MMVLGELIGLLENAPQKNRVHFVFGTPVFFCSYRGYYDQLAIVFDTAPGPSEFQGPTVSELLKMAQGVVGVALTGWKGGEFRMELSTPIWVTPAGSRTCNCTPRRVFSVGGITIIDVGWCAS